MNVPQTGGGSHPVPDLDPSMFEDIQHLGQAVPPPQGLRLDGGRRFRGVPPSAPTPLGGKPLTHCGIESAGLRIPDRFQARIVAAGVYFENPFDVTVEISKAPKVIVAE